MSILLLPFQVCVETPYFPDSPVPPVILPDANIDPTEYKTIVVIPDVHGDYYAAVMSLWIAYQQRVEAEFKRI